jgi:hypothetical protein
MASNNQGKGAIVVVAKQLMAGMQNHLSSATPVFDGSTFTADKIASKLQALVDLRSGVDTAQAAAKAKLAVEAAQAPALRAFTRQFRAFVKASFASSPDVLADFGIASKSRVPRTVEEKAAAAAKSAATRSARHTMGARQKKGVKGDVIGVLVIPTKAPATTVAAPSSPTTAATSAGPTAAATPHTA